MEDKKLTLVEHLEELRGRVIRSVIVIVVTTCLVYSFVGSILSVMVKPIGKLVFLAPQEAFMANIKVAFWGGLFLTSPFILYEVWKFISVALDIRERRLVSIFGPLSFLFFILGTSFGYFVIIPIGIKFLLAFSTDYLVPMISISNYVSFVGALTFVFGLVFELPLALLFLTKLKLVTPQFLSQKRRHAIIIVFIVAAALTPPDVVTQFLMAVPLIILYEVGIIFSKLVYKPV